MNCQLRGLASIRKGLGKENTPFLVSTNSIMASENVSGRLSGESYGSLKRVILIKPEGSQSGGVPILPIRRGLVFANPIGFLFLPIRRGLSFANPEVYYFCQPGGVMILPILRGTIFLKSRQKQNRSKHGYLRH